MMVTGFLRVFTSVLLLLAMTATFVHQAGATTTTSSSPTDGDTAATDAPTSSGTSDCTAERATCNADATCSSCLSADSSSAAVTECNTGSLLTTTVSGCDLNMETACCLDDISEFECMDNAAYVDFFDCGLALIGCTDGFTCDGAEVADSGAPARLGYASTAVAFSCSFMAALSLLWA